MAMVALLALVVIGPRDLPKVMRTVGRYVRQARGIMRDFQSNLEKMVEEEGLEDVKETAQRARKFNTNQEIENLVDPDKSVRGTAEEVERSARGDGEASETGSTGRGDAAGADTGPGPTSGNGSSSVTAEPTGPATEHQETRGADRSTGNS
ncbi:twin arginine-targeting protein translocase TatB [Limimonas halophila]|uniref:Twin arginine-targeting protein translocase TatB n=2 Tax=Limimonas halophila TaxID=1082479 RepID=A0A1G7NH42_9PROT|nr:twin arginine-targeting protein translocase TatB [Limimonas halophila]